MTRPFVEGLLNCPVCGQSALVHYFLDAQHAALLNGDVHKQCAPHLHYAIALVGSVVQNAETLMGVNVYEPGDPAAIQFLN